MIGEVLVIAVWLGYILVGLDVMDQAKDAGIAYPQHFLTWAPWFIACVILWPLVLVWLRRCA